MIGALLMTMMTATLAAAPISVPDRYPTEGTAITISLSGSASGADALRFTYQPDSRVVKTQTIKVAGAATVSWIPAHAGIVTIHALDRTAKVIATKDVSVKFKGTPTSGLLIFLGAGLVLFGGVLLSMRLIFAAED